MLHLTLWTALLSVCHYSCSRGLSSSVATTAALHQLSMDRIQGRMMTLTTTVLATATPSFSLQSALFSNVPSSIYVPGDPPNAQEGYAGPPPPPWSALNPALESMAATFSPGPTTSALAVSPSWTYDSDWTTDLSSTTPAKFSSSSDMAVAMTPANEMDHTPYTHDMGMSMTGVLTPFILISASASIDSSAMPTTRPVPDPAVTTFSTASASPAPTSDTKLSTIPTAPLSPSQRKESENDTIRLPVGAFAILVVASIACMALFAILIGLRCRKHRAQNEDGRESEKTTPDLRVFRGHTFRQGHDEPQSTLEAVGKEDHSPSSRRAPESGERDKVRLSIFPGWPKWVAQRAKGDGGKTQHVDFEMVTGRETRG